MNYERLEENRCFIKRLQNKLLLLLLLVFFVDYTFCA